MELPMHPTWQEAWRHICAVCGFSDQSLLALAYLCEQDDPSLIGPRAEDAGRAVWLSISTPIFPGWGSLVRSDKLDVPSRWDNEHRPAQAMDALAQCAAYGKGKTFFDPPTVREAHEAYTEAFHKLDDSRPNARRGSTGTRRRPAPNSHANWALSAARSSRSERLTFRGLADTVPSNTRSQDANPTA